MGIVNRVEADNYLMSIATGKPAPWIFEAPEGKQPGLIRDYNKELVKYNSRFIDGKGTLFQGDKEVLIKEDATRRILECHGNHRSVTATFHKVQERFVCYNLLKLVKQVVGDCAPCHPGPSGNTITEVKEEVMPELADQMGFLQTAAASQGGKKAYATRSKVKHVTQTVTTTTSYNSCESLSPSGDASTPLTSVAQPSRGRPCPDAELNRAGVLTRFWAADMKCVKTTRGHNFVIHLHCQGTRTVFAIAHADNGAAAYAQAIGQHVLGYEEGEREVMMPVHWSLAMIRETNELVVARHVRGVLPIMRRSPIIHPDHGVSNRLQTSFRRSFVSNSDQYAEFPIEPKYWDRLLPLVTRVINLDSDSLTGPFPYNKAYRVSPFELDDIQRDSDDDF